MPVRPSHIGLCVRDVEVSLRFYCDGLGFEPAERYELDDTMFEPGDLARALEVDAPVQLCSQMIRRGDLNIELLGFGSPHAVGPAPARRNQLGFTHLSMIVDDVDAVAARLVELGGAVLPATRAVLGYDVMFLADPDGVRIELMGRRVPRA